MRLTISNGAAFAALAFAVAGCAQMRGSSGGPQSPSAQKVQTPQEQSQQALDQASESQKKANEQAKRAAAAQQEVQQKQQELQAAQQKAQQEQQKAEQLQLQANQQTQQATQQAKQSQKQATAALSQQTQQVQRGEQSIQGQVSQANARQIVVQPQGGDAMTFDITGATRVQIDGRQASAAQIRPGENALVSYEVSGTQPTARSVQVVTGNLMKGGAAGSLGKSPGSSGSGSSSPGSSPDSSGSGGNVPSSPPPSGASTPAR